MFNNILFVCIGNICRSPTAEVLMRRAVQGTDIRVSSAGLGALVGRGIEPTAQALLLEHGLDGSDHRARQADAAILEAADLILTMERRHLSLITRRMPQVSGKTFLLGKWQGDREISDPYRKQRVAFEHVFRLVDEGVASWRRYL